MKTLPILIALLWSSLTARADETIHVTGKAPRWTPAKSVQGVGKPLPYSDEAVLSDAWTRAWLVLEVNEQGVVERMKFLKRPGFDLDGIAIATAFAMTFTPARDQYDRPMRSHVIWPLEWPSAGWLVARNGIYSAQHLVDVWGNPLENNVPCAGSGPLQMDSIHPVYRDCSQPDLSKANTLPWIERPKK
ncbi:MAG TPA: hypothetical protein VGC41_21655 [Kofleriaceae bacterium]